MKTVDIIVPCYNEEPVLTSYYNETEKLYPEYRVTHLIIFL